MLAGAPLAFRPLAASRRRFLASAIVTSPLVGGGGAISFTAVRRHTIGADLAGGGALQLVTARRHNESPAVIGGAAALVTLARRLAVAPAVAGGGAVAAVLARIVVRVDSERRTRGGDEGSRARAAGESRLRFPNFDSASERIREGG